jgi:Putative Flp pilus-assembly TadE/G-like
VLCLLMLAVLLGISALAIDVGSWYQADQKAQAAVDASALAGAQALPADTGQAAGLANEYLDKNGGGDRTIALSTASRFNDTITVTVARPTPGFFSKVFGLDSVVVHAKASARAVKIVQPRWVAPIVVKETNPLLQCLPEPCYGQDTTLTYTHLKDNGNGAGNDGSGSFGFINLVQGGGNPGTSTLGSWIRDGLDGYMPLGSYDARTGNPFSASAITDALTARIGSEIMLPIYRTLTGTGSGAQYEIIGWVGFYLTGFNFHGNKEELYGHFTQTIWEGLEAESSPSGATSLGISSIQLVE